MVRTIQTIQSSLSRRVGKVRWNTDSARTQTGLAGVRVGDVTDIVCNLFVEEMLRRWPVEAVSWITSFQPVGALARVGYAPYYTLHLSSAVVVVC